MKVRNIGILTLILGLFFLFNSTCSVMAQDSGAEVEFTLEEITVTAEKREENMQKVPVAIEAISGDKLDELGIVDFYDALGSLTSVHMRGTSRGFDPSLRGISNDGGSQDSPVAVTIDGDYTRRSEATTAGLLDTSRIEVLNGPQGTLYGRLSTAGVVNIISNNPTEDYEASGMISAGSYSLLQMQGTMNVPVNETWAFRAAFRSVVRDGYLSLGESDNDEKTARVKSSYKPNDDVTLVLTVEKTKTTGRGSGSVVPFTTQDELDDEDDAWDSKYDNDGTYAKTDMVRYVADLNWDLGFSSLTVHPSIRKHKRNMAWILMDNLQERQEVTTEKAGEVRLASPADSKMTWLMGLYYYDRDQTDDASVEATGASQASSATSESKAVFGSMSYPITDRFSVNGGMRYTSDNETEEGTRNGEVQDPTDNEFDNTDYKIGVEYDFAEEYMLWADFSTGFRAGKQSNNPEYLDAYQIGSKNRFFDNALQLNISAFYYDYQNYQAEKTLTYEDGTFEMGAAVGDAVIYGVDIQTNYILTKKDRIDLGVSYLKGQYDNVVVTYDYADPEYYDGMDKPRAPRWTINGTYEHTFYLVDGGTLKASWTTRFESKSKVSFAVDPQYGLDERVNIMEAHTMSNATLTYGAPSGKWSLSGYVKNIENFAYKEQLMGSAMSVGAPRTYALQLSITY